MREFAQINNSVENAIDTNRQFVIDLTNDSVD